jgi:calcium-dependent protein kinase
MRAVKTIRKALIREDPTTREMFINEIWMLRRMDHPNILKIYDLIEERNYYHIVTELWTGGELFAYIVNSHGITETIAAHIMR